MTPTACHSAGVLSWILGRGLLERGSRACVPDRPKVVWRPVGDRKRFSRFRSYHCSAINGWPDGISCFAWATWPRR